MLDEIRRGFANLADGVILGVESLPGAYPGWIFRESGSFGVAIEVADDVLVSERFSGARLFTAKREFGGHVRYLLRLESKRESLRHQFASICTEFLDPGENGVMRKKLASDPLEWWTDWRELLGDAVRSEAAYGVLGELLVLERLIKLGKNPVWLGPLAGVVDIETSSCAYEVKSTISRYESIIHVAGQFQLAPLPSNALFLVHQRFEQVTVGDSVQLAAQRLCSLGIDKYKLEMLLEQCGLEEGCSARGHGFRLIESRIYPVDDNFPKITVTSFVGSVLPRGIEGLEYQVDLSGLASLRFDDSQEA